MGRGGGGDLLVQGVVWHSLYLFCMDERFGLSPALKWFNSSSFLHFSYGSGFHGTKDCPQADVLNVVQFTGVRLGWSRPALAPYTRDGRTAPMQTVFRILELANECISDNLFRTASFLVPFVSKFSMCGFHERWVSSLTPIKVGVST